MLNQYSTYPAQSAQLSNTIIVLNSGAWVNVPDGADPDAFRRYAQAKEDRELNPKPAKKQTYHRQDNGSKRNRRARLLFPCGPGMLATARRMDEPKAEVETDDFIFSSDIDWDGDIETKLTYPIPFLGEPVPYESEADDYAAQQGW